MNILIAGDSFSCELLSGQHGWPAKIKELYHVKNVSRPGVGEFKILQQLKAQKISEFNTVIVSHTNPYRLYIETNPFYPEGHLYNRSDIIFTDIEHKSKKDQRARFLSSIFPYLVDYDYARFVHESACREIENVVGNVRCIHITHFNYSGFYQPTGLKNFFDVWKENSGDYNHYDVPGNDLILGWLVKELEHAR